MSNEFNAAQGPTDRSEAWSRALRTASRWARRCVASPCCVFVLFGALYLGNGALLPGNDLRPSVFLPHTLLSHGALTFSPADYPFMFRFKLRSGERETRLAARERADLERAAATGDVLLVGWKYYLVPTVFPDRYASIFGVIPGLAATPLVALRALLDPRNAFTPQALAAAARLTAAALAAATVALLYMIAAARLSTERAWLAAFVLGAATALWSTTSQGLLQHGPCTFFTMLAIWGMSARAPSRGRLFGVGAALGVAVAARPTASVIAVALLGFSIWRHRRASLALLLGALPFALALGVYNHVLFGAPWRSAQLLIDPAMVSSVGGGDLWSTPIGAGAAGLLLSPGRGLLVHSPIVLWTVVGLWHARHDADRVLLGVLACAALAMWLIAFKWFDWWGGWCFGYRPLVDTLPLLMACMLTAIERVHVRSPSGLLFMTALAFSVAVQVLGAWAYEPLGWNAKAGRDINLPRYRYRLWDWSDPPIIHYTRRFSQAHEERLRLARLWESDPQI